MKIVFEFDTDKSTDDLLDDITVVMLKHIKRGLVKPDMGWWHKDDKKANKKLNKAVDDLLVYYGGNVCL